MTAQEVEKEQGASMIAYLDVTRDGLALPTTIVKRDGRVVTLDIERIEKALTRCFTPRIA